MTDAPPTGPAVLPSPPAAAAAATATAAPRRPLFVGAFVATSFLGAFLLFLVQPLTARQLLPSLGGSPAVWNAALVFFQLALLAGYGWAHLVGRLAPVRRVAAQLVLVALGVIVLPVAVPEGWRPPGEWPQLWTIGLLALMVGLPFLALATTSPTLQRWFAGTDHPRAANPYFLYAAGNAGSLAGLLAYPLLVERTVGLDAQSRLWAGGYVAFIAGTAGCAYLQHRHHGPVGPGEPAAAPGPTGGEEPAPTWRTGLRWAAIAAVPSGLLLGVTRHISTDVAAVALLWVVPLALYLATFIVAFARPDSERLLRAAGWAYAVLLLPVAVSLSGTVRLLEQVILLHLLAFTAAALVAHVSLARSRPGPAHLTAFYVWLAVGGAAGGTLTAIVAPLVFRRVWEYPLWLAAAAFIGVRPAAGRWAAAYAVLAGVTVGVAVRLYQGWTPEGVATSLGLAVGLAAAALAWWRRGRLVHAGLLAVLTLLLAGVGDRALASRRVPLLGTRTFWFDAVDRHELTVRRTFFGVYRVLEAQGDKHRLVHGTTTHGEQWMADPAARAVPRSYYHRSSPIGQWFTAREDGPARSVALVGLGAGTMAAYGRPGDRLDFYEIDPEVVDLARDPRYFTYLADARAPVEVVLGDARLRLEATERSYDVIVLDAFGSDAIPTHLLTREAVELYLQRLRPGGVIAFHVSSRTFELAPPLARIADRLGLAGAHQSHVPSATEAADGAYATEYVLLARSAADLGPELATSRWTPLERFRHGPEWTDDFVDLLSAFRWQLTR